MAPLYVPDRTAVQQRPLPRNPQKRGQCGPWLRLRPVPRHKDPPRDCLTGGKWPRGEPKEDAPAEVRIVQTIVRRLRTLMDKSEMSVRYLAIDADLHPQTVHNLLDGKAWPDLPTIYRLEYVLGERLWVHSRLPHGIETLKPYKFGRQIGVTSYLESDGWETVIAPVNIGPDSWSWRTRRFTKEGWTADGEGTAADPHAAEQAADQHIADRIAAETPPSEEQPERWTGPRR